MKKLPPNKKPVGRVEIDWSNSLSKGLVAVYFNGEEHNIVDNKITATGGYAVSHVDGKCYRFDDTAGKEIKPTLSAFSSSEITVLAKTNYIGGNVDHALFDINNQALVLWADRQATNSLRPTIYAGGTPLYGTTDSLNTGKWNIWGATAERGASTSANIWLNGVNDATSANIGNADWTGSTNVSIGDLYTSTGKEMDGDLSFIMVWDRVLSDSEIAAHYKDPYQILKPVKQTPTLLLPPEPKELAWMPEKSYGNKKPVEAVEVDWAHPLSKHLVVAHILNDKTNLADNTHGSFTGNAYITGATGLELDGTGDSMNFSANTQNNLAFGTGDFTIITKVRYETPTSSFPAIISNGDTAAGEWMLRYTAGGGQDWDFYGNSGSISAFVPHIPTAGESYFIVVVRNGATLSVSVYESDGTFIGSASDTSATADLNAVNANACLGGADSNSGRWWQGGIEFAYVWKGVNLSSSERQQIIKNPYQILKLVKQIKSPLHKASQRKGYKVYR